MGLTQTPQALKLSDVVLQEIDIRTTVAHVCDTDLPAALELLAERPLAPVLVDRVVAARGRGAGRLRARSQPGPSHGKVLVEPRRG